MMTLSVARARAVTKLMGEAFELGRNPVAVERHLLTGVLSIVGGIGSLRVLVGNYTPDGGSQITSGASIGFDADVARRQRVVQQYYADCTVDPAIRSLLGRAGMEESDAICHRRAELVDDRAWYNSEYVNELRRPARIDDAIYTGLCYGHSRGEGIGVFRGWGDRPFTDEDRDLLLLFQRDVLPRFRLPGEVDVPTARLSRRERETLGALLRGTHRKQIAADMGISVATVNQHVKAIYRRFGVNGYPALVARCRR